MMGTSGGCWVLKSVYKFPQQKEDEPGLDVESEPEEGEIKE